MSNKYFDRSGCYYLNDKSMFFFWHRNFILLWRKKVWQMERREHLFFLATLWHLIWFYFKLFEGQKENSAPSKMATAITTTKTCNKKKLTVALEGEMAKKKWVQLETVVLIMTTSKWRTDTKEWTLNTNESRRWETRDEEWMKKEHKFWSGRSGGGYGDGRANCNLQSFKRICAKECVSGGVSV